MKNFQLLSMFTINLFLAVLSTGAFADDQECPHVQYGVPIYSDITTCYEGYAMAYSYELKAALWVSYSLDRQVGEGVERQDDFRKNDDIPEKYATTPEDYEEPVYDMGHLANSESIDTSVNANSETFLMSNMTPQLPGHNRAIWKGLEIRERKWANNFGNVTVIAGAIYTVGYKTIGNGVPVPSYYWKIIFRPDQNEAIAFIIPHKKLSTKYLDDYIVSVDSLEETTGFDFFSNLPDEIENKIESIKYEKQWD